MRARQVQAVQTDRFPPLRNFAHGGVQYRLGHQIGIGSTSKVYRGQDEWGNALAVKVYENAAEKKTWRHEAAMLQRFRGPGVVQLQCSFMHEGDAYLAMRDAGVPVSRLRIAAVENRRKALMQVAGSLLQTLHGLHVRGWMHCDVNPGNVLLHGSRGRIGAVRLADFALCRPQAELQNGGRFPMAYWLPPPEYFERSREIVPQAVDIFHASAVLFSVLKGEVLDYGQEEILAGKLTGDVLAMRDPLSAALAAGLAVNASERPAAVELWRMLRDALAAASNAGADLPLADHADAEKEQADG